MSLILEALRKSEAERRRAQAPDLFAEPQLALPRVRPAWPHGWWLALGGVVLIAVVLLVRAMGSAATPAVAAPIATAPQPAPEAPSVASTPEPSSTPARARTAAVAQPAPQPAPVTAPVSAPPIAARPETTVVAPPVPQPRTRPEPIAAAPVHAPAPIVVPAPAATTTDAGTQRLADLTAEERQQLPPLKLSMHMWNDAPAQRFVIVDGQRLGEGDRIGAAVVEQITRDGAILAWNGHRLRVGVR